MNIIETNFSFLGLVKRSKTELLVLHHAAGTGSVEDVHKAHLKNGWAGIGYHFYIRKDGKVYRGRPIDTVGSHCLGHNSNSIGVCFEGNYEVDTIMPTAQLESGKEIVKYIQNMYPNIQIRRHKDLMATACPGKNFPFSEIVYSSLYDNNQDDKKEEGEEEEMIYNYIDNNMPEWARPTIQKLVNKGLLKGNEKGELGLNDTMLKLLVINDRAGLYD